MAIIVTVVKKKLKCSGTMSEMSSRTERCDSGNDERELDRKVKEVVAIAKEECREDVIDNFSTTLLRSYVSEHCGKRSPRDILASLQSAIYCREEIYEIERNMDKNHFVELVTGGHFMAGGVDKETGLPIFWIQSGRLDTGSCGSISAGLPAQMRTFGLSRRPPKT